MSREPLKVLLMSGEPLKLRRERLSPEHWETLLNSCSGMITREPLTALLRHLARESLKALLGGGQTVPPVAEVVSSSPPGLEDNPRIRSHCAVVRRRMTLCLQAAA